MKTAFCGLVDRKKGDSGFALNVYQNEIVRWVMQHSAQEVAAVGVPSGSSAAKRQLLRLRKIRID